MRAGVWEMAAEEGDGGTLAVHPTRTPSSPNHSGWEICAPEEAENWSVILHAPEGRSFQRMNIEEFATPEEAHVFAQKFHEVFPYVGGPDQEVTQANEQGHERDSLFGVQQSEHETNRQENEKYRAIKDLQSLMYDKLSSEMPEDTITSLVEIRDELDRLGEMFASYDKTAAHIGALRDAMTAETLNGTMQEVGALSDDIFTGLIDTEYVFSTEAETNPRIPENMQPLLDLIHRPDDTPPLSITKPLLTGRHPDDTRSPTEIFDADLCSEWQKAAENGSILKVHPPKTAKELRGQGTFLEEQIFKRWGVLLYSKENQAIAEAHCLTGFRKQEQARDFAETFQKAFPHLHLENIPDRQSTLGHARDWLFGAQQPEPEPTREQGRDDDLER